MSRSFTLSDLKPFFYHFNIAFSLLKLFFFQFKNQSLKKHSQTNTKKGLRKTSITEIDWTQGNRYSDQTEFYTFFSRLHDDSAGQHQKHVKQILITFFKYHRCQKATTAFFCSQCILAFISVYFLKFVNRNSFSQAKQAIFKWKQNRRIWNEKVERKRRKEWRAVAAAAAAIEASTSL